MAKDRRRSELAKIHIAAKQLFDDEGDYCRESHYSGSRVGFFLTLL